MRRHYVYYHVPEDRVGEAAAAITAFHSQFGPCELLRRPGARGGLVTLMEIHADAERASALEARATVALAPWIVGERHVEVFETLA